MDPLLQTLPKHKKQHSIRVAKTLKKAGANKESIYAAALHDYLERGGDIESLSNHIESLNLSSRIITIVQSLSQDESSTDPNQPLSHLKSVLGTVQDADLKNILIKLSDRLDNLKCRGHKASPKYKQKSIELTQFLIANYTGEDAPFKKLVKKLSRILTV